MTSFQSVLSELKEIKDDVIDYSAKEASSKCEKNNQQSGRSDNIKSDEKNNTC